MGQAVGPLCDAGSVRRLELGVYVLLAAAIVAGLVLTLVRARQEVYYIPGYGVAIAAVAGIVAVAAIGVGWRARAGASSRWLRSAGRSPSSVCCPCFRCSWSQRRCSYWRSGCRAASTAPRRSSRACCWGSVYTSSRSSRSRRRSSTARPDLPARTSSSGRRPTPRRVVARQTPLERPAEEGLAARRTSTRTAAGTAGSSTSSFDTSRRADRSPRVAAGRRRPRAAQDWAMTRPSRSALCTMVPGTFARLDASASSMTMMSTGTPMSPRARRK